MPRLTGQQVRQVQEAFLSGFGYEDLVQLVRFELNETLENVVPRGPLKDVVLALIQWAEQQGRTAELIVAAIRARPRNAEIAALEALRVALTTAPAPVPPAPPAPVASASDLQKRLRQALLGQFPQTSDLEILVNDALGQELGQVAGGDNHTKVCFNLVKWLWIDHPGRLRPLLAGAVQERPNSDELKALQRELFPG